MQKLPVQLWIFFVVAQCANGVVWWVRGTRLHPEKRASYTKLVLGLVLWGSLPWLVVGVGAMTGQLSSIDELIHPQIGRSFVLAFHLSVIAVLILGGLWLFFGKGAQTIVDHPGLANYPIQSPSQVKALWAASLAGVAIIECILWLAL